MQEGFKYDVIVVGAGHAGCEAAAAAANIGCRVLLVTMDMNKIAQMSCNPAVGGIAKGQIVREIDALGGYMGYVTDRSAIQFRMLNKSKGPAMWSPRAQCDRAVFSTVWRSVLESLRNIDFWQDVVTSLIIEEKRIVGVKTAMGNQIIGRSVILTNGTFLNGLMHIGNVKIKGGRISDPSSYGITEQLVELGFITGRMKTGTPPRLDGRSINFSRMEKQAGDNGGGKFSFLNFGNEIPDQKPCYITYTNPEVHQVLEEGFKDSPLFSGKIKGLGPRYCPSIEDKIVTFSEKTRHQLFLEPEGRDTVEYYINGFSSSLPREIQIKALRLVPGLEEVRMFRPGYAIEYDYFAPIQLKATLETKLIDNLYFAGQINGTTGYEEAAGQGIIAGVNAALNGNDGSEFILKRDDGYIGVLIDDLINKGVDEPYRMFTSRAEFRLLLRQDNADERLTELSNQIGLASEDRVKLLNQKMDIVNRVSHFLSSFSISPEGINSFLIGKQLSPIKQKVKLFEILLRPQISIFELAENIPEMKASIGIMNYITKDALQSVEIKFKYRGYIERERNMAEKLKRLDHISINPDFNYENLKSISTEGRQKLNLHKPLSIGQASRISGVSPADVSVLLVHFGR